MTITVSATIPSDVGGRPEIVLIHGAANSAPVWSFWQQELGKIGWATYAVNLRGHGPGDHFDLSRTTMGRLCF